LVDTLRKLPQESDLYYKTSNFFDPAAQESHRLPPCNQS
jgi:hypothetical protein